MIERRSTPTVPRERVLLPSAQFSDFGLGWIARGMNVPLQGGESAEFVAGWREHFNNCISELLGEDE